MTASVIDGKAVAAALREETRLGVEAFVSEFNRAPGLATVLVGGDPGSAIYVGAKQRACAEAGIVGFDHRLEEDARHEMVAELLEALNSDPGVSGILLQLPVPDQLDGASLTALIDPAKDVDGLTPINAGRLSQGLAGLRPCTPAGVLDLLASVDTQIEGAEAVVLGRSNLFGKPMGQLLLAGNATVTTCHSRTRELASVCARADILIAAVGQPELVRAGWVKPGAVVIDVGMNRLESGLVGDVDFAGVAEVARAITPVPGGVGPMTIACLLRNTLIAARLQMASGTARDRSPG
ncbi:MAG: methylenetetrahydrofolate dehydrogenase / methenyltetrahydrofolate cyclohydrolase [Solirubrobacteraceae bacterium]|jgi:methylenetetrahydrofolate dehydrogenase (NADP+)/methenyltetrahydrofolate cyclohydrolase|nr:methylenetetrahydrofolate dehydrogenase / methenyltetrahydrofolate cyclohydrolase [Solirubrobacteraceae bacterium]